MKTGNTCRLCGGPISNPYGYCQRNKECRNAGEKARKQAARESGNRFSCLGCGCPVWPRAGRDSTYTCGKGRCHGLGRELATLLRSLEAA